MSSEDENQVIAPEQHEYLIGDSRRVRSAEDVRTLIRDVMVEDNRFFILLAKHLSISPRHLSQIMTGNAKLSAQRMFDMLEYLNLQVWVERE